MTTTSRSLLLALVPALAVSACVQGPPPPDSIYEGRSSRYGAGSESTKKKKDTTTSNRYGAGSSERESAREESRNRFGYGNQEEAVDTPPPAARDRRRDRVVDSTDEVAVKPAEKKPDPKPAPKPTSSGPPTLSEMPYAKGVPGNPLAVTVPGYGYVGQVSIEKLDKNGNPSGEAQPPGTAVQIADPKNPGKTIYFRVP